MSLIAFTKKTSNSATDIEAVRQTGQGNVLHFFSIWTHDVIRCGTLPFIAVIPLLM